MRLEYLLISKRTYIWFMASILGNSRQPLTTAPRGSDVLSYGPHGHLQTLTHYNRHKYNETKQ